MTVPLIRFYGDYRLKKYIEETLVFLVLIRLFFFYPSFIPGFGLSLISPLIN